MRYLPLAITSTAFCWVLSPDGLVLLGNLAGRGRFSFFAALFACASLFFSISRIDLHQQTLNTDHPSRFFGTALGAYILLSLTIGCYLGLATLLPTGALVTAGFTFNETFLYWFPNFGFSFLLLGIVLCAHVMGPRIPQYLQLITVSVSIFGLLTLSLAGLFLSEATALTTSASATTSSGLTLFAGTTLLFLGVLEAPKTLPQNSSLKVKNSVLLVITVLVVALWALASLLHVPSEKLANSTIPYILGAREVLGQPGRIIMGITIISGALALTNGLLLILQAKISEERITLRLRRLSPLKTQQITALLVCLTIGLFMARGLAGYDILETFIRTTLLLWLYMTAFKALLNGLKVAAPSRLLIAPIILLAISVYLLALAATTVTSLTILALFLCGVILTMLWVRSSRPQTSIS